MTIVYIDDDADDCEIMVEAFKDIDEDINCITFTASTEGMKYLTEIQDLPDFIFLDINMPRMNGRECLIKIKANEKLKHIPVVMCSTTVQTREMKIYFELGAYDFIVKPNNMGKLYAALESIIYSNGRGK